MPSFDAGEAPRRSISSLDPSVAPRKILALAPITAAVVYGGFLCLLYFSQTSMIYPGAKNSVEANPPRSQGAELFKVSTALGNVEALFLPASPTVDNTRQPVVIFGHGNGEVIDYWLTALNGFRQRGIGVLLVEYPGYGRSTGSPSEKPSAVSKVLGISGSRSDHVS